MDLTARDLIINKLTYSLVDMLTNFLQGKKKPEDCVITLTPVTTGDRSPLIIRSRDVENEFFLFYPRFSKSYTHELYGVRKRCEVIQGEIHEAVCGKTFTPESGEFIIEPDQSYKPYTTGSTCIARVIIEPTQTP
jgi:hypothetical protein